MPITHGNGLPKLCKKLTSYQQAKSLGLSLYTGLSQLGLLDHVKLLGKELF